MVWQVDGRAVLFNGRFAVTKACPCMPFLFALTAALSQRERESKESKNRVGMKKRCS